MRDESRLLGGTADLQKSRRATFSASYLQVEFDSSLTWDDDLLRYLNLEVYYSDLVILSFDNRSREPYSQ